MKKHAIAFLLLLFCLSRSQAQQLKNPYPAKIDSLQTLINQQTKADTTTVKHLNYLARVCFHDMQYQRGLVATIEARQLAKHLHYAKGEGLYWRTLEIFSVGPLDYYYYNNLAKWVYTDRKQKEENVQLVAAYSGGNIEKRKAELLAALTYFEKHPDREILANLLFTCAGFTKQDEQLVYIDKAVRQFRENNQPTPPFFIIVVKMRILERAGKQKEAKEAEIEARTILANTRNSRETALMNYFLGQLYGAQNRQDLGFEFTQKADQLLEKIGEKELRPDVLESLGQICHSLSLNKKAVEYFKKEAALREETNNDNGSGLKWIYHKVAFTLIELNALEEAKIFIEKARKVPDSHHDINTKRRDDSQRYDALGQVLMGEGKYQEALQNFVQSLTYANQLPSHSAIDFYVNYYIAQCYQKLGQTQESIQYGKLSYDKASASNTGDGRLVTLKSSLLLAEVYEAAAQPLEAYKYLKVHQKLRKETDQKDAANHLLDLEVQSVIDKDEKEKNRLKQEQLLQSQHILAIEKQREIDGLKAKVANQLLQVRAEQAELDKKLDKERLETKALQNQRQQDYKISLLNLDIDNQRKIRTGLLGGLALFALFVVGLVRQNRVRQRFNQTLTKQKGEIERQRDKVERTLTDLRATQAQLIQKEKLASLGELTAGIAHEIQNPLNFVNNFSEVSVELLAEQKEALAKGDTQEADFIADDLNNNLKKIHHHGSRASAIVRGMLEHSRSETGERRPTDLNALAQEYLNIAYHGLRAKEKAFDCELVTDFDPALGQVSVVPQEIGRVLLNLYNNAFYAVSERAKQGQVTYQPTVTVGSKRLADGVEIRVGDNGTGIPESVKAKIFQPFFTTKPTGEGAGLGLSLSYDIVTKGHGGTLMTESVEGEGAEFVIHLPA